MKLPLLIILLILSALTPAISAQNVMDVRVSLSTNLQADAAIAKARGVPLLLMFSLDNCPYCMVVQEEFLDPMQRNRDYDSKVLMRILKMDEAYITDFDGQRIAVDDLTLRYGAAVAPTVVLLDHQGRMLTERLLGITTPDFYGGYLDAAIERSLQRLQQPLTLVQDQTQWDR